MPLSPYLRLMRLHAPIGIWLLLWPCLWAGALASPGFPSLRLILLFSLGAVLMRGTGCIVNDIADREFDAQIERTQNRPLASGELTLPQAFALLALLLFLSLLIALQLGPLVVLWSALALVPVMIYPLMKRISWWPQLFLGLTFNWGALMGWVAVRGAIEPPALLLYLGGICWTLGYDTIYAHQDKHDDARIGVRSTALKLGGHSGTFIGAIYALSIFFFALAGYSAGAAMYFYAILPLASLHFAWQVKKLALDTPEIMRKLFFSNALAGGIVFLACLFSRI